jgi:hypothetical protein
VKHERVLEHVSARAPGVSPHAGGRGVVKRTTSEGGEHPRGNGDLDALRKLDDETLRGLAPEPSDKLHRVSAEGMG